MGSLAEVRFWKVWHLSTVRAVQRVGRFRSNNGHCWILARDGSVANDQSGHRNGNRARRQNDRYGVLSGCFRAPSPYGVTRRRELVAVAVAQIYYDPVVRDRFIDAALEIAIAHFEKMIALKDAARRYPIAHENAEDLAANVLIGRPVGHKSPIFER
jgi:hypothetical protein